MTCEKCGKEFLEDFRKDKRAITLNPIPRFCSRSCACSRSNTEDTNRKRSISNKKYYEEHKEEFDLKYRNEGHRGWVLTDSDRLKGRTANAARILEKNLQYLNEGAYEKMSHNFRRKRLLEESNNACQSCGNDTWLGKKIWLEIHHRNGNSKDNRRENLIVVCLNCHSILDDNYRSKNK